MPTGGGGVAQQGICVDDGFDRGVVDGAACGGEAEFPQGR